MAGERYDRAGMIGLYQELIQRFGIVTIEDPLTEEDFEGFAELTEASGIQIVGDDLFVTNPRRLAQGVEVGAANSLLWKVNQIGTLSEALDAAELAHRSGYTVVVSERSGETEDPIIADLVVALNAGQIKTGAPVRGERTAKYNRLIQIEEELGSDQRVRRPVGRALPAGGCVTTTRRTQVRNREALLALGLPDLRTAVLDVLEAGLEASDPALAVDRRLAFDGAVLTADGRPYPIAGRSVMVLGAGKASLRIAVALETMLGDCIDAGLVVVPRGQGGRLDRIEVIEADHPLPTPDSVTAARRLMALAGTARPGDLVICCFTGGSSALASLPPAGIDHQHKHTLHRLLLQSGRVDRRGELRPKARVELQGRPSGGRDGGATILNLTVSDVAGDPLDAITDPTVPDTTSVADAIAVLERHGLWNAVPGAGARAPVRLRPGGVALAGHRGHRHA